MFKIPYIFRPMPDEFLTEDFLKDSTMFRLGVWIIKRAYPDSHYVALKKSATQLYLEPFEFMYGRDSCARDLNTTPNRVRTRIKQLIGLGYIVEISHKSTSTFSVYKLVTTAFKQNSSQQSHQQNEQQVDHLVHHKRDTKIKENQNIKETSNVPKNVDKSHLSDKQKEDLSVFLAYCESKELRIFEPSLIRWLCKYEIDHIIGHLALLDEKKNKIEKHEAWLEKALKDNYVGQNNNIQKNCEFAEQFKESNQWNDLHTTQRYCTHAPSSKDFQYKLPVDVFQKMLQECYEQYKGMYN